MTISAIIGDWWWQLVNPSDYHKFVCRLHYKIKNVENRINLIAEIKSVLGILVLCWM